MATRAKTLAELRAFPRDALDLDSTELPDAIVDVFILDGYDKVLADETHWPFFQSSWDFSTTAATASYAFSAIDETLEDITGIQGERWVLEFVDHEQARRNYLPDFNMSREPELYSIHEDTLYLWPTPDGVYDYSITGYRKATDWITGGAGAFPDCPDDGHDSIALWALGLTYAQQDDPQLGAFYQGLAAEGFQRFRKRHMKSPQPQPLVMNLQRTSAGGYRLPPQLRYPFPR